MARPTRAALETWLVLPFHTCVHQRLARAIALLDREWAQSVADALGSRLSAFVRAGRSHTLRCQLGYKWECSGWGAVVVHDNYIVHTILV